MKLRFQLEQFKSLFEIFRFTYIQILVEKKETGFEHFFIGNLVPFFSLQCPFVEVREEFGMSLWKEIRKGEE